MNWLSLLLWAFGIFAVAPFVVPLADLWWQRAKPYIVGGSNAARNAFTGKVAVALLAFAVGCFAPSAYAWVRDHGWTWPTIPDVVPTPAEGKRQAFIVRESEADTPEFGILANQLRNGDSAKYLTTKGHTLTIHDDDDVDASGQPVAILAANKPFSGVELLIFDSGKLLSRAACPATASGVIEAIKRSGG